ncbi:MAG: hypothetical protein ACE5R6_04775 [Candidatus Heimdallarchaeota archaeon]
MVNSIKEVKKRKLLPQWVIITAGVIFGIMAVFSIVASENPDGLEKTFEKIGVVGTESGLISFGETLASNLLTMAIGMTGAFLLLIAIVLVLKKLERPT